MSRVWGVLLVLVAATATSVADPTPPATLGPPAIADAIKQAAAAKKPLVLEFSAQWCKPCQVFEMDVLTSMTVRAALGDVTWVRYDAEVPPGTAAAAWYRIDAFPTFLVVDAAGIERVRRQGMLDEPGFLAFLRDAPIQIEDEVAIRASLRARPKDPEVHLHAARWFAQRQMTTEAIAQYTCVAKDHTATTASHDEAYAAAEHLRRLDVWRHDLVADKVAKIKQALATAEPEDLAIATIDSDVATKDVKALLAAVLAAQTDVARTNAIVYIALTAGAKDEALAAAKHLVAQSRQAQFLDTLAECHHAVGDRATALQLEDEALAVVGGSAMAETIKRNRERFDANGGEADESTQLRHQVAELWKRLSTADHLPAAVAASPSTGMTAAARSQAMQAWQQSWDAEKAIASTVATTCAKEAGKTELALAQVDVSTTGAVTPTKILVEANAPKLSACITKALAGTTLPVMKNRPKREIRIQFAHP